MASAQSPGPDPAAVREQLDRVTDPELDRSIVELEYIDRVRVLPPRVIVEFTLPTAWCSPAFAWMMASDAREAVEELPGVERAVVYLHDHMHAEEINHGVNRDLSFGEAFPDADGGVREVRATLDDKARLARQHDAVTELLDAGLQPAQVVELTRGDLDLSEPATVSLGGDSFAVTVEPEPLRAYLQKARATGHVTGADDRLFYTPEGEPIPVERFELVRRRTRLAQVNMGGQGSVCDALNEARSRPR
jgi:metal-sulfur cluster biosynthetic enzyme